MATNVNDFADKLQVDLKLYASEITDGVKKIAEEIAKECRKEIKAKSPEKTGEYKKGWKIKKIETSDNISYTIYNAKEPGLTHLLEYGHAKINGGRVRAFPHIRPAEEKAKKEFVQLVNAMIKSN